MPRQSTRQLMNRLADGRCPIHGATMVQVGYAEDEKTEIVECTQADCGIRGTRSSPEAGVVLLSEFVHLLDPDRPEI